ncbi:HNH endonuclease [Microbacterium atlanticum]|uniref:HNH endonuclease n=1 Tax=Microbacterium atlanticum TaxID=2782168 RepID=UPI001887718E|nr:HNH endonuclease signature motif containing protein [Microbacterium atlanticum]
MSDHLAPLAAAVDAARGLWGERAVESLAPGALMQLNQLLAQTQRLLDASKARVAAEISRQSRPELGPEGLAKSQGYRNPTALIAAVGGSTAGDAARLVKVGEATAPRLTLSGETAPAKHPHVAEALARGELTAGAAAAIIAMLDRVALRAEREALDKAERTLSAQARGLSADQLTRVITRAEAWLDPLGVAPREDEQRAETVLHVHEDRTGMVVLNGRFAPDVGAPIKLAVEQYVAAVLRAQRDDDVPDASRRSIPQIQAEALSKIAEHGLGCAEKDLPLTGATVVVRIDHADLVEGTGYATIDGLAAPISVATARRMAAGGGVISAVFGGDSDVLDWGRRRRFFSDAQRLALVERDGGCAMCSAPPSHTKAHHLRWWARDAGPTDLRNGVLLCEACHHRIHDNGWEIQVNGPGMRAKVKFIPPAHVDPARTPRLGGRARFDFAA